MKTGTQKAFVRAGAVVGAGAETNSFGSATLLISWVSDEHLSYCFSFETVQTLSLV